jgi:hypothetical protein
MTGVGIAALVVLGPAAPLVLATVLISSIALFPLLVSAAKRARALLSQNPPNALEERTPLLDAEKAEAANSQKLPSLEQKPTNAPTLRSNALPLHMQPQAVNQGHRSDAPTPTPSTHSFDSTAWPLRQPQAFNSNGPQQRDPRVGFDYDGTRQVPQTSRRHSRIR